MLLAAYTRFSSELQRDESIDAQLRAIFEWAERNGHKIIHEYVDRAISGRTDERPEFLKMINDSSNSNWDGVVIHKLYRFSRNRYDSAIYKKKLKNNGKAIFSVLENLDGNPESIILESVLEGMSEYYSANLGREVKKGHKENALKCKHNGGIPLLGYDIDKDLNYVINEHEAKIVKLIFDRYSKGYTIGKIINELNKNGYKTKRGNIFVKSSIYDLARNEKYTGVYTFGYGGRQKGRNKPSPEMIKIDGGMPQIIEKEVFEMVKNRTTRKIVGSR